MQSIVGIAFSYGIQIPKISDLTYEVSEEAMNIVIQSSRNFWNVTWDIVMDVVERRNWRSFVKVLYFSFFYFLHLDQLDNMNKQPWNCFVSGDSVCTYIEDSRKIHIFNCDGNW